MDANDPKNPYQSPAPHSSGDSEQPSKPRQRSGQYTVKDLVSYSGLFGGIIAMFYLLEPLGWGHWWRVGAGIVVGLGLSWVFEIGYRKWVEEPRAEYEQQMRGEKKDDRV